MVRKFIRRFKNFLKYQLYKDTLPRNPMHDDIYLVEFPKSGVTWLQHILGNIELQLLGIEDEFITFYNHHKYLPDVHQLKGAEINRFLKRTFIKSHSLYNPYYYFVIYIIRNPFDVMVSYYNYLRFLGNKESFGKFVRNKKYGIYAWKRHVNSWINRVVQAQRIHVIRYEDLKDNPVTTLKNLYFNLGVKLDEMTINYAIDNSSIEVMKKSEEHYRKNNPNYKMNFVGKEGKIRKDTLMNKEVEEFIRDIVKNELIEFFPELSDEGDLL